MRSKVNLILLLFAPLATYGSWFSSNSQQAIVADDLDVPGSNPLKFCSDPGSFSLTIDHVDLTPNPPKKGQELVVQARGNFTEKITDGATVHLQVKYGLITLIRRTADLCQNLEKINEKCPLEGEKTIVKVIDLPNEIPPGTYHVEADVYSQDNTPITCLKAEAKF